ncbi:MAG: hypothetical protein HY898_19090 [Deltaproteobacteria bacterium]|nr:hypothetical protein [Deltaproteobacteria bacterium]
MTRIAVLICGSIGIALVARAAMFYRSTDRLSFGLAILIGSGLLVGLTELFLRAARAERLMSELRRKAPDTLEAVDTCSVELKGLLRRRLAGNAVQIPAAWFTTYLLGLLVMVGMLGTFLGLFESLRGAREALTTSGDVDALRSALVSPLQGLSRAFGLSAAGVSASATLGLAAVFTRRAESRFVEVITAIVTGPLSAFTAAGRQLTALEVVAAHGPDLALSARALQDASRQLEALRTEMIASQEAAAARSAEAIRATAAEVRADLRAGIDRAAEATDKALRPLFDHVSGRVSEVAQQHQAAGLALQAETRQIEALRRDLLSSQEASAARSAEAIRATAAEVRKDIQGGIDRAVQATETAVGPLFDRLADRAGQAAGEHLARWSDRLEEESKARELAHARHLEEVRAALSEAAASVSAEVRPGVQKLEKQLAAVLEQVAARLIELASTQQAQADSLGRAMHGMVESAADADRARAEALRAEVERLLQGVSQRIDQWLEASSSSGEQVARKHDEAARVVRERLDALVEEVRRSTTQLADDERARATALHEHLERTARSVEAAASSSAQADVERVRSLRDTAEQVRLDLERSAEAGRMRTEQIASAVERFAGALDHVEQQASARMHEQVALLVGSMAEQVARLEADHLKRSAEAAASLERLDGVLSAHLQQLGKGLAEPLAEVIRASIRAPEAAAQLVVSARHSLEQRQDADSRRDGQAEALLERLADAAGAVTRAAASHGESIEAFVQAAERRTAQAEARSEERLGKLLEGMQSVVELQAERLAAFESRLETARGQSAEALAERLSEHARVLAESVTATATVVHEAADLVHAGGAEMSSVAEMFTAAVDQYRAASDRLMNGLGPIEEAMERAGQRDTVDLLGAYLDQTREVFDSSLRFQRELFSELRALRTGRSPADA